MLFHPGSEGAMRGIELQIVHLPVSVIERGGPRLRGGIGKQQERNAEQQVQFDATLQ
jgi:hypothetical protein